MIYEGRPNVTVDAFGLALKSGNAVLLRGSSSAAQSNAGAGRRAARRAGQPRTCPPTPSSCCPPTTGPRVTHLIQARGLVDVVIPRGGAGLIDAVVRDAQVPTIETGVGNCHVYVHEAADLDVAERILLNSKTRRPSVCNAAETLLVDAAIAGARGAAAGRRPAGRRGDGAPRPRRGRPARASTSRWTSRWRWSTASTPRSPTSTSTAPDTPRPSSPPIWLPPNGSPNGSMRPR